MVGGKEIGRSIPSHPANRHSQRRELQSHDGKEGESFEDDHG
jgi:hypothetical protein